MQTTESPLQLRLWTVDEYHRMAEVGIFEPSERVEFNYKFYSLFIYLISPNWQFSFMLN